MKLIKCYIENFGILSNFKYNFQDGINIIKENNGFGKTTFANFIKAMFYGLDSKRNTKILIDRKKYEPWQGGNFGGYIEFEIDQKKYRLERYFEKKEADDIFKLYDLNTNLESNDYSSNIGEEIFKLNREAFDRSIFISGQNMQTSMNDSINAKLGNVLESENDINSSEKALKILDDAIKNYKKTGGRGEINEKIIEKTNLEHKLEKSKIDEKILLELKENNRKLGEQLKEKLDKQKEYQNLISTISKEEIKKTKIEQYNLLITNCKKSELDLKTLKEKISENSDINEPIIENKRKMEILNSKNINLNKRIKNKNKQKYLSLGVLILLLIIGILLYICKLKTMIIIIPLIMCIVPILVLIITNNYTKRVQEEININNNEIEKIESIINTLNEVNQKQIQEYNSEFERLSKEYNEKLRDIKKYEEDNNIELLLSEENRINNVEINKNELEDNLEEISKEINHLNDEKNYIKNRIESMESNLDVFEIENEIEVITSEIETMSSRLNTLENTKKYLEQAKENFSSHYLKNMEDSFIRNFEIINGEKIDLNLDVNLNVQILKYGKNKKIDYLSTGYKDLINICIRLSLAETLFENEEPFIVLDDPFVNLDENKMKRAIELIKNLEKKYQIIYFACHESRNIN